MFCLFSPSKCVELLQICGEKVDIPVCEDLKPEMHSSESRGVQSGPLLLQQLGRLIIRARSTSPSAPAAHKPPPSTSQIQSQPPVKSEEDECALEEQLSSHVNQLWNDMEPLCIEVLLAPACSECSGAPFSRTRHCALLLERWTMVTDCKSEESAAFINSQWLLNAVRSQLHFSQLSAWLATLQPTEPRRKLSREQCNYKKIEANTDEKRKLNIVYSINGDKTDFTRPPTDHTFPLTDIGNNTYLKITLQSLPRIDDIPTLKCPCVNELVGKLNDLTISRNNGARKLSLTKEVVDDRMLTPCSENGKHKCCDDESDNNKQPTKKLDERRLKEIAKYKRRIRKEKMKCESTSSEDGKLKETTSIPILQASRFDRFRAIGCYRNQTYLTLPASRIETKSPFVETDFVEPEIRRTNTVGTQTEFVCDCGNVIEMKCDNCTKGMVRSEANYNLASLSGARRKFDENEEDDDKALKKHKCDNSISNISDNIIKRPKLRRVLNEKLDKIVCDRNRNIEDVKELHLNADDTVFSVANESKRQKTFSISDDDYVFYEKCDYGTIDSHETPFKFALPDQDHDFDYKNGESLKDGFVFPDPKKGNDNVPSSSEMDKFRYRFDSAASMVFHTKTGLPLTSSPAPLRRGNNCFDFDDSINGISGIKSALFHPISPVSPAGPASPPASLTPRVKREHKLKIPPSTGLLGSFEESALQGRLEAVATVHGFTAELGASGAFCPPHKRLPVTVFFYAPGGTNAPYMGHINLGPQGYRVSRSGTIQVSLFNPHGTLVKMFVVLYDLTCMPAMARTFLRQRTLYMPAQTSEPPRSCLQRWLRYLIHLRFMTSKSGKLYLHTDIRLIVSRKADLDTATAHSALFRPIPTKNDIDQEKRNNDQEKRNNDQEKRNNDQEKRNNDQEKRNNDQEKRAPNRVFGGSSDFDSERNDFENQNGVSYELRSFTYAPENPKYSPR